MRGRKAAAEARYGLVLRVQPSRTVDTCTTLKVKAGKITVEEALKVREPDRAEDSEKYKSLH